MQRKQVFFALRAGSGAFLCPVQSCLCVRCKVAFVQRCPVCFARAPLHKGNGISLSPVCFARHIVCARALRFAPAKHDTKTNNAQGRAMYNEAQKGRGEAQKTYKIGQNLSIHVYAVHSGYISRSKPPKTLLRCYIGHSNAQNTHDAEGSLRAL